MTGPGAREPQPGEPEHRPRWAGARPTGDEPRFSGMHCPVDSRGCVDPEHCQQGGPCAVARRHAGVESAE